MDPEVVSDMCKEEFNFCCILVQYTLNYFSSWCEWCVCVSCVWLEVYLQQQVEITHKVGDRTQTLMPFSPILNYIFGDSSPSFGYWHGLRRQPSTADESW